MQEEVIKHTRKIKNEIDNKKHSLKDKLKEIAMEITIIVFAVSLSIYLHDFSEKRHQNQEAKDFLIDLKTDLKNDILELSNEKIELKNNILQFEFLKKITPENFDEFQKEGKIYLKLMPTYQKTNDGNFEGFKSSGKIGYIENKQLKYKILEYYQVNNRKVRDVEQYYLKQMEKIGDLSNNSLSSKDFYLSPVTKANLDFVIQYGNNDIEFYNESIKLANEIIKIIDYEKNN
jgi:hypothetical protein